MPGNVFNNLIFVKSYLLEFKMGFSVSHLLVVLAIVLVIFGTKRLKNIGTDLGGAIKGFRTAVAEGEDKGKSDKSDVIDGDAFFKNDKA